MTDLSLSTAELPEDPRHRPLDLASLEDPFQSKKGFQSNAQFSSDVIEGSANTQRIQESQRRDVQALRDEILKSRLSLRELRIDLGRQRAKIREMEIKLWKEWQFHRNNDNDLNGKVLDELYEDIDQALDVMGPGEEDYNDKEDELNVMELELEGLEADFYSTIDSPGNFTRPRSHTASSLSRNSLATMRSEGAKMGSAVDSPMHQYLSRLGDARIIKERLYELISEKSQYLDIQKNREAVGHPQYQPNVDFLADYERIYNEELSQLQIVETEVASLARKAGVETASTGGTLELPVHTSWVATAMSDSSGQITAASEGISATPQLTPEPTYSPTSSDTLVARLRINDWIFTILQISHLERARHKAELGNPNLDDAEWLRLVGKHWQRDQGVFDEGPPKGSTSPALARHQRSQAQSHGGSPSMTKTMLGIGGNGFSEQRQRQEPKRYDTDSFTASASRPEFSPFLASSFSSISQVGDGSAAALGCDNGCRATVAMHQLNQVSGTHEAEKRGLQIENRTRKG